jgi:hypothetical protein
MKARWKHRPEGSNWGDFGAVGSPVAPIATV